MVDSDCYYECGHDFFLLYLLVLITRHVVIIDYHLYITVIIITIIMIIILIIIIIITIIAIFVIIIKLLFTLFIYCYLVLFFYDNIRVL